MATSGNVEITIADGAAGALSIPANQLQVVIGCSSSGTAATVVATSNPRTLATEFGSGPLVEAAAMVLAAGGAVLAMRAATNTAGSLNPASPVSIVSSTNASPIVVTATAHGLLTGYVTTIASHTVNTAANGTWVVERLSADTFSLRGSTGNGVGGATGTSTWTGSIQSGSALTTTGVAAMYFSGVPYDDYYAEGTVTKAGTVGTAGITFTLSLDAGRNVGPSIALGTALTYAIAGTNLTLNFETGKTLAVGDTIRVATSAPIWATAGVQACILALQASPYGAAGFGSMHIVGVCTGANATTFQGFLDTMATVFIYTRCIVDVRDSLRPVGWGGAGETKSTWATSIVSDFSAVSAKRIAAAAGHYNMTSQYPTAAAGLPNYRRSLAWALAARQVAIPPQRHAGRVKDGALSQIVIDPTNDPLDGFNYWNEADGADGPNLDPLYGGGGRFTSACLRVGRPGYFIANPITLAPTGSDFVLLPRGVVMDRACGIVHFVGEGQINDDLLLNPNGTLNAVVKSDLESEFDGALEDGMTSVAMISSATTVVDGTNNVLTTSTVIVDVTIVGKGYVLQETLTIGFGTTAP